MYDKICKEFGFIRKFIALLIAIFKTNMIDSTCDAKAVMRFSSLIKDKLEEDGDFIQGMLHFFCAWCFFFLSPLFVLSIIKNDINVDFCVFC